jgi:hypothetical protein
LNVLQASEARHDLVLYTNRLPQDLLLDANRLNRGIVIGPSFPFEGCHGVQQSNDEAGARAHSATGGEIPVMMYFQPSIRQVFRQYRSYTVVLDLLNLLTQLGCGVYDAVTMREKRGQVPGCQVAVLVDGAGKGCSAVL